MKAHHLILLLAAFGATFLWFGRDNGSTKDRELQARRESSTRREVNTKSQYLKRLQVEERREIAPGQIITVLLVPDSMMPGMSVLDSRCVIYEHAEFRTVKMFCNGERIDDAPAAYDGPEPEPRY